MTEPSFATRPSFSARLRDASIAAIATVVVGTLTLAGAVATGWFTFVGKDEELKVRLVEIAIGILRADPTKEDVAPARGWAIEIVEKDSGVKFSPEDRADLLHKPIRAAAFSRDFSDDFGGPTVVGPVSTSDLIKQLQELQARLNNLERRSTGEIVPIGPKPKP